MNERTPSAATGSGGVSRRLAIQAAGLGAAALALLGEAASAAAQANPSMGRRGGAEELRATMRKLWEDHITWTRLFIVSKVAKLPDLDATTQRLLKNQVDIGDAIKPFFGDAAGAQLTALLTDHITGAAAVLDAAIAGDQNALQEANARWYANANDIAAFLSSANPKYWPLDTMQSMMKEHLDLTLTEATKHLQGDWTGDVMAYDAVHDEILMMADTLAAGIAARFPNKLH